MDTLSENMKAFKGSQTDNREKEIQLLFNNHIDLAERHAKNWVINKKLPQHITVEDAKQAAAEAAWEAANRYAEELCDKFGPFMIQQVQFKLRNLWRSGSGGKLLGGVHTAEDNKKSKVVVNTNNFSAEFITDEDELEKLDYNPDITDAITNASVDGVNEFTDAAYDFERNARLLPASAKHLLELNFVGNIKASQKCALQSVKVNLAAADTSVLDETDKVKLLERCDKPGVACELFDSVSPVMHEGARRDAVRAASKLYSQKWLAFLFNKSKALISGYVRGSKTPSPLLAGVCHQLATKVLSLDDVLTCRWLGTSDTRPVLTARPKSTVVNVPPPTLNPEYVHHRWMQKHHPGEITRQRKRFVDTWFDDPARPSGFNVDTSEGSPASESSPAYKLTSTAMRNDYNTACGKRHAAAKVAASHAEPGETYTYTWSCTCCPALRGTATVTKEIQ